MEKRSPNLRKNPKQERSQKTIAKILGATRMLIAESEIGSAPTMAQIAARSELSAGSLYQYFSDFEAILSELLRCHQAEMETLITEAIKNAHHLSLDEVMAICVKKTVDLHLSNRKLHLMINRYVPLNKNLDNRLKMESGIIEAIKTLLNNHFPNRDRDQLEVGAILMFELVRSTVHKMIEDPVKTDAQDVKSNTTSMMFNYTQVYSNGSLPIPE